MAQGKLPNGMVERERTLGISPARVVELVDTRRRESLRYNNALFNTLQARYDTFRCVRAASDLAQFRNNLSIPFTFAMIQSWVARMVQTSFGAWPIVTFEGYAPEDQARAKRLEVLLSAQMKDCDSVVRSNDFFLQDAICGTAILRYGWKNLTRKVRVRRMEQVAPGMRIPVRYEYDAELFNGPTWEVVNREDFWQQPARKRIDDMAWVIHRYWLDWDDMMEDAQGPYPYFDKGAVQALREFPLEGAGYQEFRQRRLNMRYEQDDMARRMERFAKPVEVWEMHGLVPSEFAPDGIRHRCVAIGNGRAVLKNRESAQPYVKPFLSYSSMPDPYGFDGVAKAEIASKPQRIADRLANQKLDAIDLLIDPMWVMSSSANINKDHLFTRAGRILLVDGAADETNLRALSPNMAGFQAAYPEITTLYQYMQLGLGINDILLGQSAGQRETARGFLGRQENTLTRIALEQKLADEQFVEPLANAFRKLDRDLLPVPQEIKVLGSLATTNPITGLPYHPEQQTIDYDDLAQDYRARAVGATQMIGQSARKQDIIQLLQVLSANPAMMQVVNWATFARQAFELFDFRNMDELLNPIVPQIAQVAQDSGMSPEGVSAMATTNLERLSPDVLGQMMQTQQSSPLAGAY
jgi:hypothetical protein